jgi:hypothetical protein
MADSADLTDMYDSSAARSATEWLALPPVQSTHVAVPSTKAGVQAVSTGQHEIVPQQRMPRNFDSSEAYALHGLLSILSQAR